MKKIKSFISKFVMSNPIKKTYIIYASCFILIPSLLLNSTMSLLTFSTLKRNYAANYINSVNLECENAVNSLLEHINNIMIDLSTNQKLYLHILDEKILSDEKRGFIENELMHFFENVETVAGVRIKTKTDEYSFLKENINDFDTIDKRWEFESKLDRSKFYIDSTSVSGIDGCYIKIAKKLFNFYNGYEIGNIMIYIQENILKSIYGDLVSHNDSLFLAVDDRVVSHNDNGKIGTWIYNDKDIFSCAEINLKDANQFLVNTFNIDKKFLKNNLKMISVLSHERIIKNIVGITIQLFFITSAFLLVGTILIILFSNSLTRQIERVKMNMINFKDYLLKGKKYKKNKRTTNEIAALEKSFEKMIEEMRCLISQVEESNTKRREAELNALQSQINPHFLYNVLDVICWIAKIENQTLIEKMITALSGFYRMGLHNGQKEIPVRDEIEHVKNFIFLHKVRFPDSFHVEFDVDDEILDKKIIKIVLQPLVENSIKHGFKNMEKGGIIRIRGRIIDDSYCEFVIVDNGCGIIQDPLNEESEQQGYGVKNVNERLIMAYGSECGLQYKKLTEKEHPFTGTKVSFKFKTANMDRVVQE